ncbi:MULTISPECIES: helix-turn-helix domain-containing protein [Streptomyces]|uniref:Helix-turn-helix transcriptional regulator n=1 Tax=Streptomyces evansiae TaxID=3075535 RepID=A0ABU2R458_9ACTN|nr:MULTISPECIES: helix-turn-helix transcriptional regulator [unclassified Streptomyces]MDT0411486.1 helix-turn-helix transcriptional regulator [Streptomyces sp. DSM 41979]MYQ59015.1 helix-turn-helix domain-containing protein [Streptomyces sp. SID4926]SCE26229.1 Helix-turn-helix domain-containing protein [Streptomyces sp. DfronAA-171]
MPSRRAVTGRSAHPRRRFAQELRRLRCAQGLPLRKLSHRLGWDHSLLGKMERTETLGGPEVVQALDDFYGTQDLLLALWELALRDRDEFKEQYRTYMGLEAEATSMWHFGLDILHGLLQTPEYARERMGLGGGMTETALDEQVSARMRRRARLHGAEAPVFRAIFSEAALRTPLTDRAQWRAQLEDLLRAAKSRHITLHVLPFAAGLHGLASTNLTFLRQPDGSTVAYTENSVSGHVIDSPAQIEFLQRRYDAVRDQALAPAASDTFIQQLLEEPPHRVPPLRSLTREA